MENRTEKRILFLGKENTFTPSKIRTLKENNYLLITTTTAEHTLEIAASEDPLDLLLVEAEISTEPEGREAVLEIQRLRDLPVIIVASLESLERVLEAEGIRYYGYFLKDSGEKAILATLSRALRIHKSICEEREREREIEELGSYFTFGLDLLCIADLEGRFRRLNPEWGKTLGYTIPELVNKNFFDLIHPEDLEATRQAVARLREGKDVLNFINRYRCKDNSYRYIEWKSRQQKDLIYAVARDITDKVAEEKAIKTLISSAEDFLRRDAQDIDYRFLAEIAKELSGAKYSCFNVFEPSGRTFLTKAIAGMPEQISKASSMLGFNLQEKRWKYDPVREEKIRDRDVTVFPSLAELVGEVLPKSIIAGMIKTFKTGETVLIKIHRGEKILGDFTLIMPEGKGVKNLQLLEIYARQVGLLFARKKVQDALLRERRRLEWIIQGTNAGTWEWNIKTGELVINSRWATLLGYTLEELHPITIDTWRRFCNPEDYRRSEELLERHFQGLVDYYEMETRMLHKKGHWVWVLDRGKVVEWDKDERPLHMAGTHTEITHRKEMEEALEVALKEKEMLLKELQHRVKNSFALISSLISLEKESKSDFKSRQVLQDVEGRIGVVGNLYNLLYRQGVEKVPLAQYIENLCSTLAEAFSSTHREIKLSLSLEEVSIDPKRASSLGLILNELLTNAYKHAFSDRTHGTIAVTLSSEGNSFFITVEDDGKGMPPGFQLEDSQGFGYLLVRLLCEELGGRIETENLNPGTKFVLKVLKSSR